MVGLNQNKDKEAEALGQKETDWSDCILDNWYSKGNSSNLKGQFLNI